MGTFCPRKNELRGKSIKDLSQDLGLIFPRISVEPFGDTVRMMLTDAAGTANTVCGKAKFPVLKNAARTHRE